MNITVIITTRNRCTDLERTCGVLIELTPQPHEVIITADGCTDETVNMIRAQFPQFRLFINSESLGSVSARDRMLRAAVGDVVVSLDDDSYPLQRDFLTRVADAF